MKNFCLNAEGDILACYGAGVRVYSPRGELLKTLPLEIRPTAICREADGSIFVAGDGRLLKPDAAGKVLASGYFSMPMDFPGCAVSDRQEARTKIESSGNNAIGRRIELRGIYESPLRKQIRNAQNRMDGRNAPRGSLYNPWLIKVIGCVTRNP